MKKGVDKVDGDDANEPEIDLREHWNEVGKDFGNAGRSLGKAITGTAKKVADKADDIVDGDKNDKKQEEKPDGNQEEKPDEVVDDEKQ